MKSDGRLPENLLQPKDVTRRALANSCIDCRRALSLFCVIMGAFWWRHGAYAWRYVLVALCRATEGSSKRQASAAGSKTKDVFKSYVQDIPVYLIVHDNPGLLGSGAHLRQVLSRIL